MEFVEERLLVLRMTAQEVECPGQGLGGRVTPSGEVVHCCVGNDAVIRDVVKE